MWCQPQFHQYQISIHQYLLSSKLCAVSQNAMYFTSLVQIIPQSILLYYYYIAGWLPVPLEIP